MMDDEGILFLRNDGGGMIVVWKRDRGSMVRERGLNLSSLYNFIHVTTQLGGRWDHADETSEDPLLVSRL